MTIQEDEYKLTCDHPRVRKVSKLRVVCLNCGAQRPTVHVIAQMGPREFKGPDLGKYWVSYFGARP